MAEQENDTARFILPNLSLTAPSPHWPLYSTWTRSIPQRYTFKLYTFQPRNKPVEHSEEQQKNRYERGKIDRIQFKSPPQETRNKTETISPEVIPPKSTQEQGQKEDNSKNMNYLVLSPVLIVKKSVGQFNNLDTPKQMNTPLSQSKAEQQGTVMTKTGDIQSDQSGKDYKRKRISKPRRRYQTTWQYLQRKKLF